MSTDVSRLHSPKPCVLTPETDAFGTLPKAEGIKEVLDGFIATPCAKLNHKVLALYGEWGCGKTSVMKWLEKQYLENENVEVFFFEAWKYENDDNLAQSLIDCLCSKNYNLGEESSKLRKYLTAFTSATSLNIMGYGGSFDKKEFDRIMEGQPSQFKRYNRFVDEYTKLENELTNQVGNENNDRKVLILIDDLDRCNPDAVVNLLSALKNFFVCGEKTIVLCALDQEATKQAYETKYSKSVHSEVFLEKLFDFSFHMPVAFSTSKIVNNVLPNMNLSKCEHINRFFKAIDFTNPRKITHVVNKLNVLFSTIDDSEQNTVISNILHAYFFILLEYHPCLYNEIHDRSVKRRQLLEQYWNYEKERVQESAKRDISIESLEKRYHQILSPAGMKYDLFNFISLMKENFVSNSENTNKTIAPLFHLLLPNPQSPLSPDNTVQTYLQAFNDSNCNIPMKFVQYLWWQCPEWYDWIENDEQFANKLKKESIIEISFAFRDKH